MTPRTLRNCARDESGVVMVIVVMTMSLMLALGLALTLTTITEAQVAAHHQRGVEAQYAAEALMDRVVAELRTAPDWTPFVNGTATVSFTVGSPPGVALVPQVATSPANAEAPVWRLIAFGPLDRLLPGEIDSPLSVMAWVSSGPANGEMEVYAQAIGPDGGVRTIAVTLSRRQAEGEVATMGGRIVAWRQDD